MYYQLFSSGAEEVMEKLDNGTLDFGILIEPVDILKYEYISFPTKNYWGILMRRDDILAEKLEILPEDIKNPSYHSKTCGTSEGTFQMAFTGYF